MTEENELPDRLLVFVIEDMFWRRTEADYA